MRTLLLAASLLVVSVCWSTASLAACSLTDNVQVYEGFDTGADLAKLSDVQLTAFVEAFIDGLSLAPLLNAPSDCTAQAYACLVGKTEDQLVAALRKYLADHPDEVAEGANFVAYRALFGSCMFKGEPVRGVPIPRSSSGSTSRVQL
jgi:hypothetical protein